MKVPDEGQDVPYGDDWHSAAAVDAWSAAADKKRPWRSEFRDAIADHVSTLGPNARVLELGSGPGLLAEHVLAHCPSLADYTLLDFSAPMLALSRQRLGRFPHASFLQADFRNDDWMEGIGDPFDCVVSMQAIHELRHKRHAGHLYQRIRRVTRTSGLVLICDHTPLDDSERSDALYMTESEQLATLASAGFVDAKVALSVSKLVLYVTAVSEVTVVDYDPSWPRLFEALSSAISAAMTDLALSIEHVGSTAVPGLAAKPVIDIDVVVLESNLSACIARLETLGYQHLGDLGVPQREAFRRPTGSAVHHLYLCPSTSPALANHLAIRDHLRAHPSDARAYGDLKKRLALDFAHDIDGYVEAKTAFLVAILRRQGLPADLLTEIERINRRPT